MGPTEQRSDRQVNLGGPDPHPGTPWGSSRGLRIRGIQEEEKRWRSTREQTRYQSNLRFRIKPFQGHAKCDKAIRSNIDLLGRVRSTRWRPITWRRCPIFASSSTVVGLSPRHPRCFFRRGAWKALLPNPFWCSGGLGRLVQICLAAFGAVDWIEFGRSDSQLTAYTVLLFVGWLWDYCPNRSDDHMVIS